MQTTIFVTSDNIQFEDLKNETYIGNGTTEIVLKSFKISNDTDDYILKPIEIYHSSHTTKFGIKISFERNPSGITEILMNYHLMCSMLVLTSSINFLIDPKCVPGRVGLLVTLFLVLTSFFSAAQVCTCLIDILIRQIATFIKVYVAFDMGFRPLIDRFQ